MNPEPEEDDSEETVEAECQKCGAIEKISMQGQIDIEIKFPNAEFYCDKCFAEVERELKEQLN